MHKATREALRKTGYLDRIEHNRGIKTTPRLGYFDFIELLDRSAFVISDGGSNQEECFYLGKPVALLRDRTERREGVGENCIVTGYSNEEIQNFIEDLEQYRRTSEPWRFSPSSVVVDELERNVRGV
jgi:UDP-N-acetylglucosamine 2-epimerase (non-hydrolysing)